MTTRIGVLLVGDVQLLDASPIDLFAMLTPAYLEACGFPQPVISSGQDMAIHYISQTPNLNACTANAALRVTDSLESADCAPGKLDILLIPGPDPRAVPNEAVKAFVRAHAEAKDTIVMTVCTGVFVAGYAGILDGKKVTGPRGLVSKLREKFPEARWVEKRWEVDGRVWTSGE